MNTTLKLTDGSKIATRPLAEDDKDLLVEAFGRLSETSRYRRFFTIVSSLEGPMLAYLTEIDHDHHEALIALDPETGTIIGVARYVRLAEDADSAEVAITIVDEWHGRGVGKALLARLVARARRRGVRRLIAIVKADNPAAVGLFTSLGSARVVELGSELTIEIDLVHGRAPARRRSLRRRSSRVRSRSARPERASWSAAT